MDDSGKIILRKPVLINGVEVKEMTYDVDEIDGALYTQAEAKKIKASGAKAGNLAGAVELDYSLHLYIGFAAVIAVNPAYTFEDMERIKGKSLREFYRIGRSVFIGSESSKAENSGEQSEITPEPTIQVQQNLKKSQ